MSLQKIVERLEAEKRNKIEEIRKKKEKEFNEFVLKKEKEFEEWKELQKKKFEEKLTREESTALSQLRLKYNSEKARVEAEVIAKVKDRLIQKMKGLSKEDYIKIWDNILKTENLDNAEIIMTKNENKLDINYFYNKYKLKIKDEKIDGVGGFIINKENIVIDLTLDNLVNELVNENILEIAQILRGEK